MDTKPANVATPVYTERTTCRACHHGILGSVLELGNQALINFTRTRDPNLPRAPLDLVRCTGCGLLQLRHSVQPDLMWRDYFYRSSINQTMRDALADVVLEASHYAREGAWLDIGANDGYLLSRVSQRFTKIACEPALNMHPLLEEHADKIVPDYFSAEPVLEMADRFDVITSCAMFYDVNTPDRFVHDIALCLAPGGVWINQLSDAPTMLKLNAFDSICHEHACYYDVPTLQALYLRHGLHIVGVSFNSVNGGSVRVAAMKHRGSGTAPTLGIPDTPFAEVVAFAERVKRWKTLMSELLDMPSVRNNELWALGASTKGAVMLQYLDMADRFVAIADRNPAKYGTFQSGTDIAVLDEATMRKAKPRYVLNNIWAFKDELLSRESSLRASGTVLINPLPNPEFVL